MMKTKDPHLRRDKNLQKNPQKKRMVKYRKPRMEEETGRIEAEVEEEEERDLSRKMRKLMSPVEAVEEEAEAIEAIEAEEKEVEAEETEVEVTEDREAEEVPNLFGKKDRKEKHRKQLSFREMAGM